MGERGAPGSAHLFQGPADEAGTPFRQRCSSARQQAGRVRCPRGVTCRSEAARGGRLRIQPAAYFGRLPPSSKVR